LKTNIYPVPDLNNPFLGVHFTIRTDGRIKIGPTAIPAFWREHYVGLDNFRWSEFLELIWRELGLLASSNFDFKRLAVEELMKYSRRRMVALASKLAEGVRPEHYVTWGQPGLRAQLMDLRTRKLEMDFIIEGDARSLHILNAVSPAFTCSLPFARYVCDQIDQRLV
jgi:L-2-hydroxyglutarate oxidase LhgO